MSELTDAELHEVVEFEFMLLVDRRTGYRRTISKTIDERIAAMKQVLSRLESLSAGAVQPMPLREAMEVGRLANTLRVVRSQINSLIDQLADYGQSNEGAAPKEHRVRPLTEGPMSKGGQNILEVDADGFLALGPQPPAPQGSGGAAHRQSKECGAALGGSKLQPIIKCSCGFTIDCRNDRGREVECPLCGNQHTRKERGE